MGIYEIHCNRTGKKYIGSSKDIEKRWQAHISHLNNRSHHNYYLQRAWIAYVEEDFVFSMLEEVYDEKDLLIIESQHIKRHKFNMLYNAVRDPKYIPKKDSRWMKYRAAKQLREKSKKEEEYVWGE